jgi:hypothetical protein
MFIEMGAYNNLNITLECDNCKKNFSGKLQFKVGEVRQNEYSIGDIIKVEKKDNEILGKGIAAYGVLENEVCPFCGYHNHEEYNIYIKDCKIFSVDRLFDSSPYLTNNEGRYLLAKTEPD